jgi:hypothetical protein
MNGREFGEALERAMVAKHKSMCDSTLPSADLDAFERVLNCVRAALQPITPGAGEPRKLGIIHDVECATHRAAEFFCDCRKWDEKGLATINTAEWERLRGWEKFGREAIRLARGNITLCGTCSSVRAAYDAATAGKADVP